MHFSSVASVLFLGQSALAAGVPREEPTSTAAASCAPHGDHWHCPSGVPQPSLNPDGSTNTKATQAPKATEAPHDHDDHDHDHDHGSEDECEPHGDHWHCPSGVAQPSLNPDGSVNTKATKVAQSTAAAETTGADHDHDDHDHDHDHDHDSDKECTPHGDHWHCPSGVPKPDHPPPTTFATTPSPTANANNTAAPTSSTATAAAVAVGVPVGIAATLFVMLGAMLA